jgi:TIR domain
VGGGTAGLPEAGGIRENVRVFVSYRRDDVPDATDRLTETLKNRFGNDHVFVDIDNLEIGADFEDVIGGWISRCDVLLALIGHNWQARRAEGTPRIQDPDDYVRIEIEAALRRKVRVVPVLINGAPMPTSNDLPESLVPLLRRNAKTLSREHWKIDVDELVGAIGRIKESGTGLAPPSRLSGFESEPSTATSDLASTTPLDESIGADPGTAIPAATPEETVAGAGVAGAAKAPAGSPAAPSSPARTTTAGSRRGLDGRRIAALTAGLVGVAALVVVAVVLVGALSSNPKTSTKTSPETSTPAASAPVAYIAANFEKAIVSAFNSTARTDSVNGVSPKATAATCPAQVRVAKGVKFSCGLNGVDGLTGNLSLMLTNSRGTAFSYTGKAKLLADGSTLNFPLSGDATIPVSAPASPTAAASAPTTCGKNALSFCFPLRVNGGHAVPPLNPGELSGPQYSYRLVPGSLVSDPAAVALYGGTNALAGTYKAAGNTVDVVLTAFRSTTVLQNAYAQYQSRLTDQGCKEYGSGTTNHNGQLDGDIVIFSCPNSTTPGQSDVYFTHDTTMATFTGPSASAVERFMVSWTGTGT